ncbi:UNVERIFIED_CONTAM: Trihelix transcription factor GTL1 [Sesamum calycinum]|uniref:Trihelix transcription factor GTL1 n=1 Tax=Sesamum calycinum TaxID=2727403 RepID=A0AAW2LXY4_9LAMI
MCSSSVIHEPNTSSGANPYPTHNPTTVPQSTPSLSSAPPAEQAEPPPLRGWGRGGGAYFPVNFKLGLSDNICPRNEYKDGSVSSINDGGDALLRGSEQYEVPEARQASLGMLHCWQNQEDSAIKQPPLWEPLAAEVSNENSEIVDRQEHLEMNQKEALLNCLESSKSRVQFGELEAIYKRLGTAESNNQTGETTLPVNPHLPAGLIDHGSEASIGEEASASLQDARKKRKKKKKKKTCSYYDQLLLNPMAEFFGNLVNQVMDHQENLHNKFTEVIERLDEERRTREEAWRNQELAHFEQESAARAREKTLAESREAMIVSYLEKITGQKINLHTFDPTEITHANTSGDVGVHDGTREGLKPKPLGR